MGRKHNHYTFIEKVLEDPHWAGMTAVESWHSPHEAAIYTEMDKHPHKVFDLFR